MEVTDSCGDTAWLGTYKSWGMAEEKVSKNGKNAEIRNPLRFQGQYFDTETGLHYNRHRYYDPKPGRYSGKDPIGFSGDINLYTYSPNPISWIDPLGLQRKPCPCEGQIRTDDGRLRNADGTFAFDGGPKRSASNTTHGNSRDSTAPATLYALYDRDDNFRKWGISQDHNTRYTSAELNGGKIRPLRSGPRAEMINRERRLVERFPGPDNKEPWAGKRRK
jgi:RHS repeat-associated protein